jgi:uncharacterized damage-inducible protein DinB
VVEDEGMNAKEFQQLFEYDVWANAHVLDAAAKLTAAEFTRDLGNSFPSVRDTLVHLLFAEWVWLRRWRGESPRVVFDPAEYADVEAVRARLSEVEQERAEFVAGLDEASLEQMLAYTNTKGEEWRYPLARMMQHVVNHSTYHRGQVVTMLRQLGKSAPSTDFLYYLDGVIPETRGRT